MSAPERRNVAALGGVQLHGEDVVGVEVQVVGDLESERRIAALVLRESVPVHRDRGGRHGAVEIREYAVPRHAAGARKCRR